MRRSCDLAKVERGEVLEVHVLTLECIMMMSSEAQVTSDKMDRAIPVETHSPPEKIRLLLPRFSFADRISASNGLIAFQLTTVESIEINTIYSECLNELVA